MELDLEAITEIIDVLAKHGVVQEGIKNQLADRGFLSLRPPGVTKGTNEDLPVEEYKKLIQAPVKTFKPKKYNYPIPVMPDYEHFISYPEWETHSPFSNMSEKIEVPVASEVLSPWLETLSGKLGGQVNVSKNNTELITKYRLALEIIDELGIIHQQHLATGVYDVMYDTVKFTFDKETCPVDWTELKIALGGVYEY
jgi:hypothetical protein